MFRQESNLKTKKTMIHILSSKYQGIAIFFNWPLRSFNSIIFWSSLNRLIGPDITIAPTNLLLFDITGTASAKSAALCSFIER